MHGLKRRQFITILAGTTAWPIAARGQQRERMRNIGMLLSGTSDDADFQAWIGAFHQGLARSGWIIGRNVRIDARWAGAKAEDIRKRAQELVALAPDVILAPGSAELGPLLQLTRSIPIVFVVIADPVGAGYAESLARPGGNATGFMSVEYSVSGKYLELLKEIAPGLTRVAVLRDATQSVGIGDFAVIQAMAPLLRVEVISINLSGRGEIESAVAAFARASSGGLIVVPGPAARAYRDLIVALAERHRLPAVYGGPRLFANSGGLISYGIDYIDQYHKAAGYVDRILKGEKPADLPVQAPTKYDMVINLKTAKALGLQVPPTVLARADEVIE
jgi:putative ABC transport system substrate-binding protein